jgi:hypothetical protein
MSRADRPVLIAARLRRVLIAARAAESVGLAGNARYLGAVEETAYELNAMVGFLVANVPSKDEKLERPRNAASERLPAESWAYGTRCLTHFGRPRVP